MQVGQVDLPAVVDMLAHLNRQIFYSGAKNDTTYFDLHVRRWFDKADRSMVGVRVHQPERDGDVVVLTLDKHHRLDKLGKILHPGERIRYYGFTAAIVLSQSLYMSFGCYGINVLQVIGSLQ